MKRHILSEIFNGELYNEFSPEERMLEEKFVVNTLIIIVAVMIFIGIIAFIM